MSSWATTSKRQGQFLLSPVLSVVPVAHQIFGVAVEKYGSIIAIEEITDHAKESIENVNRVNLTLKQIADET